MVNQYWIEDLVLITLFYSWTIFQKEPVDSAKFELTKLCWHMRGSLSL